MHACASHSLPYISPLSGILPGGSRLLMNVIHHFYEDNLLVFLIIRPYIHSRRSTKRLEESSSTRPSTRHAGNIGDITMAAHGHTVTWGSHAGHDSGSLRWHWLQRIGQWLAGHNPSYGHGSTMSGYGIWDSRGEQWRPFKAESALDHAAAQRGPSWSITMYNAAE
jgi:hypothetical protein